MNSIWTSYSVKWLFLTKLCGSVPSDPEIMKKWIDARKPKAVPAGAKTIDEIQEEVFQTMAEGEAEVSQLVFQRSNGGLVMRAATIKAHIKDCARVLSAQYIGKIQGERAYSTRMINGVYPDETQYWVPLLRPEGDVIMDADGVRDKPVHFRHPITGQLLSSIKQFEFVDPARMDFTLRVLGKSVSLSDLETLFQYGGVHGYAGERGDGEGKYIATIEEVN